MLLSRGCFIGTKLCYEKWKAYGSHGLQVFRWQLFDLLKKKRNRGEFTCPNADFPFFLYWCHENPLILYDISQYERYSGQYAQPRYCNHFDRSFPPYWTFLCKSSCPETVRSLNIVCSPRFLAESQYTAVDRKDDKLFRMLSISDILFVNCLITWIDFLFASQALSCVTVIANTISTWTNVQKKKFWPHPWFQTNLKP